MKIGFDISQTGDQKKGCGYFTYSLIKQLAKIDSDNQYHLYPTFGDKFWDPKQKTCQILQDNVNYGFPHESHGNAKEFWRNFTEKSEEQLGNINIIHSNNFFCPPKLKNSKLIYTLYDLSFMIHPEYTTEANRLVCFDGVFRASINADFIIAISEQSRTDFLILFPHYQPDKISVIYPASRFDSLNQVKQPKRFKALTNNQFWLTVGTIEPRKNQRRLIQAYAQLKQTQQICFPLVMAGGTGWMMDQFQKEIIQVGLEKDIILLGYTNDAELHWLYSHCFAFLYPSLYEGFGLPVLEAMQLGAPVITSNIKPITEITRDTALLVDPTQTNDITKAMLKLMNDKSYYQKIKAAGTERAKNFSWQKTAEQVLQVYEKVFLE